MTKDRVCVVTGANKGVGYAIVKELSKKFDGLIYLTARNEELGLKALKELTLNGENIQFHQLDIDNEESIAKFANFIKEKHQGLDILINNAAILFSREFDMMLDPSNQTTLMNSSKYENSHSYEIEATIRVNFFGTLNFFNAVFPLLRPHARVVNVASDSGMLAYVKSESLRNRLADVNATIQDISNMMNEYIEISKKKDFESSDYPKNAYEFSKAGIISITRIQQRMFDMDLKRADLVVNAVCPGYVMTEMTKNTGSVTPDQAAETPVYLALLAENYSGPKGEFWQKLKIIDWLNLNYKWEDNV